MKSPKKIIALNAGKETLEAMNENSPLPTIGLSSRNLAIEVNGEDILVHEPEGLVNITDCIVFNRFPTNSHFSGILLEYLEHTGATLLNKASLSYRRSTEKTAQMVRMAMHGLPVPHTYIVHVKTYREHIEKIETSLQYPMVCKLDGIRGEKVAKVSSREEIEAFVADVDLIEIFTCQKLIPNSGDIRLICALGEYFGAIKRIAQEGSFFNNVAQGATVELYEPTKDEIALALRACKVNKFDIAGVDIMHTENGPVLIEVNMGPGVDGFESVHGTNTVFSHIAKLIAEKYA